MQLAMDIAKNSTLALQIMADHDMSWQPARSDRVARGTTAERHRK